MLKRGLAAALAAALLLTGWAGAEEASADKIESMTREDIGAFVEALFTAAAGTVEEKETAARNDLSKEGREARNEENALYRAKTLPWLIEVFRPEKEDTEEPTPSAVPETTPPPEEKSSPEPAEEPVYTAADSYEAFSLREEGQAYLALLAGLGAMDQESCLQASRQVCARWMAQVDHDRLLEMNRDYICWLYAPDTQVDYPVVQGADNQKYLKVLFNGKANSSGTLFMDYRNLPDFQDPNTLIFGHHMRNGSMFGDLTHYEKQSYFEAHPFLLVLARKKILLLQVFAGYTTSADDPCYDIAISDEKEMAYFISQAGWKSDFRSGVKMKNTDRLVTLSTCAYAFQNARYILMGKIVPVWQAEPETDNAEDNSDK